MKARYRMNLDRTEEWPHGLDSAGHLGQEPARQVTSARGPHAFGATVRVFTHVMTYPRHTMVCELGWRAPAEDAAEAATLAKRLTRLETSLFENNLASINSRADQRRRVYFH